MSLLLYLGDKKRIFPDTFKRVLVYCLLPLVGGIVAYLGAKDEAQPVFWPEWLQNNNLSYAAARSFLISLFAGFVAFLIIRAFIPLLFYVPHAMAMRSMGLLEASVSKDGMQRAIGKYLKWHQDDSSVRVICISGRNLFGSEGPLYELANKGQLKVLLPRSAEDNPTIKARHATYKPGFRKCHYPEADDLVREINISKGILRENGKNKVFEHDELCMWRVVLLSGHCIVQNYFPNHAGAHSDLSPIFVFVKEPECPHSYYETFSEMFRLLSKEQHPEDDSPANSFPI